MSIIKCVAFDLDGTLLNDNKKLSNKDLNTLSKLAKSNCIRIAATGRNLYSIMNLFRDNFPFDYVVFSSGAGVMNWHTKEIIFQQHLNESETIAIQNTLIENRLDFIVKSAIPESHKMQYKINSIINNDLYNYIQYYKEHCQAFTSDIPIEKSTQFIVLLKNNQSLFEILEKQIPFAKCILTTSPVSLTDFWMEIFHKNVSKAEGIKFICADYKILDNQVLCIGNDYNDLDMLNTFKHAYVVANAPTSLKSMFTTTASNNNSGFSEAVSRYF